MSKTLSLTIASTLLLSTGYLQSAQAREVDCVNHWVNPEKNIVQCFDRNLNYMAIPLHNLSISTVANSTNIDPEDLLRRRSTSIKMVMPNLVGKDIGLAENYLLGMGVTLNLKPVRAYNKAMGKVIQQTPVPGTKLIEGQTVLLQYTGATVNPALVK